MHVRNLSGLGQKVIQNMIQIVNLCYLVGLGQESIQSVTNISYVGNSDGQALSIRTAHHPSCQDWYYPFVITRGDCWLTVHFSFELFCFNFSISHFATKLATKQVATKIFIQ